MFYLLYTSDDTQELYMYSDDTNKLALNNLNCDTNQEQEKFCLICWLNEDLNEPLFFIKELDHYIYTCNCNVLIHANCLNKWIQKTHSCPICRKYIYYQDITLQANTILQFKIITYYIIFYNYTIGLLKVITILSTLNFFWLFFFYTYFQYTTLYITLKEQYFNFY